MKHIFVSSSLVVTGNPENIPSEAELQLPDGKSIAELIDEKETKNQGENDTRESNRDSLP